jgi:enamine deaminase RidA (YjgF/YER057c/UK114 family)
VIPEGKKMLWTSGTTAGLADSVANAGTPDRFGNTKTQALNILHRLKKDLESKGLSMKDVLMLRVYIAPDKWHDRLYDYKGWNEAYSQFFNNKENPVKPIRSTIGVAGLVNPDKFIEIELVAEYP